MWEGVGSLTRDELLAAMRARGLPSAGLGQAQMAAALQEWLQLSQNREIPSVLLLLSNALRFARVRGPRSGARTLAERDSAECVLLPSTQRSRGRAHRRRTRVRLPPTRAVRERVHCTLLLP